MPSKDDCLKRMKWELRYGQMQAAPWQDKAQHAGATIDEVIAAVARTDGPLVYEIQQAFRRPALAQARAGIVHAFVREHQLFTPETESHFRAAYLAVPETTVAMWEEALERARNRYWQLTHLVTGKVRNVQAHTIYGAYTAAGWQPEECEVDGPRGISHAECDRRAAMGAEYPATYTDEDREAEDEDYNREQDEIQAAGIPPRYH